MIRRLRWRLGWFTRDEWQQRTRIVLALENQKGRMVIVDCSLSAIRLHDSLLKEKPEKDADRFVIFLPEWTRP